ncbi:hypothetical protein J1N35_022375 [Gossypium stocksii]|uniref:Uncharacterized protein n=1 Tax=Gossypium stocksii TaxID=47602 RepID=A0A9D4A3E0_9ROSI|nr:hypothetical protein J1N35_022375 [Gossypium stocksii]
MGLLASTLTVYYFVPPGTRTTYGNKAFRQRPHFTTREQEEQPLSSVEARLSQIKARFEIVETQVSTILNILQSHHPLTPTTSLKTHEEYY